LRAFLVVKPADKAHAVQQLFRRIRSEIKQSVLLPNLCRDHKSNVFGAAPAVEPEGKECEPETQLEFNV
jgi:hypothetical protein